MSARNRVTITIDTSNDAFSDGYAPVELERILIELAHDIGNNGALESEDMTVTLFDANGNNVGSAVRR